MRTIDRIEKIGGSVIQHGSLSERIYAMKVAPDDLPGLLGRLDSLAREHGYTKIVAKVRRSLEKHFSEGGFREEATIPGFFRGEEEAVFFTRYLDPERMRERDVEQVELALRLAREKADSRPGGGELDFEVEPAGTGDLEEMATVYKTVFPTYPFPIDDPAYLRETMETNVDYFCVRVNGEIAALASAEKDLDNLNAEMTDFATLPEFRGCGYALGLLDAMEEHVRGIGYRNLYTIARAVSPGMNITFARCGYYFTGTLISNTNIGGRIESMNIWHKPL